MHLWGYTQCSMKLVHKGLYGKCWIFHVFKSHTKCYCPVAHCKSDFHIYGWINWIGVYVWLYTFVYINTFDNVPFATNAFTFSFHPSMRSVEIKWCFEQFYCSNKDVTKHTTNQSIIYENAHIDMITPFSLSALQDFIWTKVYKCINVIEYASTIWIR